MSKSSEYTGKTKLSEVCDLMAAGREIDALRIVAKWPRLGEESGVITRAWSAHQSPDFYSGLHQDPAALVDAGIEAIRHKYGIQRVKVQS